MRRALPSPAQESRSTAARQGLEATPGGRTIHADRFADWTVPADCREQRQQSRVRPAHRPLAEHCRSCAHALGSRRAHRCAALESKAQAATGGEELSSQAVSELPLNKRDFSSLLLLAAGTMTDSNGATNFTAQFAINGQRGVEATFAMDGADISDPEMGGSTFSNFNVDAVEGIDSSSGWMPAEIGRGAAGFTNIHHALRRQRISRIVLRVCAQLRL